MGILATQEPGILLTAVFDSASKTLGKEIASLEAKLEEIRKAAGIKGFITATRQVGTKLTVKVLAASAEAPRAARGAAPPTRASASGGWAPKSKSAQQVGAEIKKSLGWTRK